MLRENSILLLIRSLERGGAERQLVLLAKGLVKKGYVVGVVVFYGGGSYEKELATDGIRLINLDKHGRWDIIPFFCKLVNLVRKEKPAVIHSYMSVSNILATCLKLLLPKMFIVWGVRSSNVNLSRYDGLLRWIYIIESYLARFSDRIIANSCTGKEYAVKNKFPREKIIVIPNGIETDYFVFCAEGRKLIRKEWRISDQDIVIGMVARVDPMKDHAMFLRAANVLIDADSDLRFACIGDGDPGYKEELIQMATELGISQSILWVNARDDMPRVYSALDIFCSSSSYGEGFSNSIAEAMACGIPTVVTDVGDSSLIVGDAGVVVKPGDASALAIEVKKLINMERKERQILSEACRSRIVSEFGVEKLIERTECKLFLV